MPGLLFHHQTPTKDYLHDILVPWVHYVPIKQDLSDLKEKYEWAESHPIQAQRIANRASSLALMFGTQRGFKAMYNKFYLEPLQSVVNAYQPLPSGQDWREIIASVEPELRPILKCAGKYLLDCEELDPTLDYHKRRSG
jgi:hypothetical protein|mmetsp:Transcript_4916/g.10852  ORF Transcript_4916/g.10852 Transcript_4916/m.10852 type:complete len:139 (+) Transcript_4916:1620-2036(+)|eukprot:scaffold304_cov216-Alexandrium_tamarense.AAC.8